MSKPKIASPARPPQPAPRSYALKDIRVHWPSDPDDDDTALELSGVELAQALEWIKWNYRSACAIARDWASPVRNLADVHTAAKELRGLGYVVQALGDLGHGRGLDAKAVPEMLLGLGAALDILASRFIAAEAGQYTATEATVTVGAPAPPTAVAS